MKNAKQLEWVANRNRKRIVEMVYYADVGHLGGSLSAVDILTAIYENEVDFQKEQRTRVVLSKGHAVPAAYAEFVEKGIIEEPLLRTFRHVNSKLQGHPFIRDFPQVDASTGLLGQGFSMALGMAVAKKKSGDLHKVYVMAGDGEMQEGQNWEALMAAGHYQMDNLVFIIDYNKLSSGHPTNEIICLEPLADKLKAFNQHVINIEGNNMEQILSAIEEAKKIKGKPTAIISNTIKGKGVSFMENIPKWHASGLTTEEYECAMKELNAKEEELSHGI